jgi:hypothetical protein
MSQINNLLFAIIISLTSCQDIVLPNVEGKWDLQIERGSDILWNYEQGFELLNNGTYLPRYWNMDNSNWQSESQESSILTWKLIKKNKEIRLYFYQEYSLFNETKKNTVFYTITSIQTDSMKLIGYNPDGHQLNLDMIKEQ